MSRTDEEKEPEFDGTVNEAELVSKAIEEHKTILGAEPRTDCPKIGTVVEGLGETAESPLRPMLIPRVKKANIRTFTITFVVMAIILLVALVAALAFSIMALGNINSITVPEPNLGPAKGMIIGAMVSLIVVAVAVIILIFLTFHNRRGGFTGTKEERPHSYTTIPILIFVFGLVGLIVAAILSGLAMTRINSSTVPTVHSQSRNEAARNSTICLGISVGAAVLFIVIGIILLVTFRRKIAALKVTEHIDEPVDQKEYIRKLEEESKLASMAAVERGGLVPASGIFTNTPQTTV